MPPGKLDHIITVNSTYPNYDDPENFLAFVDKTTELYTKPSAIGERDAPSSAPFNGKSPLDCFHTLLRMSRNGSSFDPARFVIMDDRSLDDDSVLLVEANYVEGDEAPNVNRTVESVRIAAEMAQHQIILLEMGVGVGMDFLQTVAQEAEDGVLRGDFMEGRVPP